ncbi:hypothetical protein WDU94_006173, partial [Cyamophila willieti]
SQQTSRVTKSIRISKKAIPKSKDIGQVHDNNVHSKQPSENNTHIKIHSEIEPPLNLGNRITKRKTIGTSPTPSIQESNGVFFPPNNQNLYNGNQYNSNYNYRHSNPQYFSGNLPIYNRFGKSYGDTNAKNIVNNIDNGFKRINETVNSGLNNYNFKTNNENFNTGLPTRNLESTALRGDPVNDLNLNGNENKPLKEDQNKSEQNESQYNPYTAYRSLLRQQTNNNTDPQNPKAINTYDTIKYSSNGNTSYSTSVSISTDFSHPQYKFGDKISEKTKRKINNIEPSTKSTDQNTIDKSNVIDRFRINLNENQTTVVTRRNFVANTNVDQNDSNKNSASFGNRNSQVYRFATTENPISTNNNPTTNSNDLQKINNPKNSKSSSTKNNFIPFYQFRAYNSSDVQPFLPKNVGNTSSLNNFGNSVSEKNNSNVFNSFRPYANFNQEFGRKIETKPNSTLKNTIPNNHKPDTPLPNFNPNTVNNFNQNNPSSQPNFNQNIASGFNHNTASNFNQNTSPKFNENTVPNFNPNTAPNFNSNTPSGFNQNTAPNFNSNTPFGFNQNTASNFNQNTPPNLNQNTLPNFNSNSLSKFNQNTAPNFNQNTSPTLNQNTAPSFNSNTPSGFNQNTASNFNQNTAPNFNQNTTLNFNQNISPILNQNSAPSFNSNSLSNFNQDTISNFNQKNPTSQPDFNQNTASNFNHNTQSTLQPIFSLNTLTSQPSNFNPNTPTNFKENTVLSQTTLQPNYNLNATPLSPLTTSTELQHLTPVPSLNTNSVLVQNNGVPGSENISLDISNDLVVLNRSSRFLLNKPIPSTYYAVPRSPILPLIPGPLQPTSYSLPPTSYSLSPSISYTVPTFTPGTTTVATPALGFTPKSYSGYDSYFGAANPITRSNLIPTFDVQVKDVMCYRSSSNSKFSSTFITSQFVPNTPMIEDAEKGLTCDVSQLDSFTYQIDFNSDDTMTACGIRTCSSELANDLLCVTIRFPVTRGLRQLTDTIVTIQCKPLPASQSQTKQISLKPVQKAKESRNLGSFLSDIKPIEMHSDLALYRKGSSGQFTNKISPGSGVELGEELQLKCNVRHNDGKNEK